MDPLGVLIVILLVLWLAGVGVGYTLGGLVHVLLIVVVIVVLVRLIRGERI